MVFSALVLGCVWEGDCHCLLASNSQSVIEEKGEGFENGKIVLACWMWPSTSIALPSHHKTYDIINL
jgi:hypothetical protein